jgi:cupin 2 domain-containing protein
MSRQEAGNIFEMPHPLRADVENVERLFGGPAVRIERIVSTGQRTPGGEWFDQEWDEWVALLEGTARLSLDDGTRIQMKAGDWIVLPAHQRHRVEETSSSPPCIWIAVHAKPVAPL